jgi:hypothetical protein
MALPAYEPIVQVVEPNRALPDQHPAHGKKQLAERPTLYLCRGARCAQPVTEPADARSAFDSLS